MNASRVAVIGSNSFSGAHFVAHLLERGANVLGISRSPEPHPAFLPYRWNGRPARFQFLQADLNHDLPTAMKVLRDFSPVHVVNFAAQSMVAQSWDHPQHWFQTNVVAQVSFHDQLRRLPGLDKYVHVGTPEVYGNCSGHVTEDHPFRPSTPYAVSRAACDMSLQTFFRTYGFPVVTTRAANVYGPGQALYRIIPRTVLSIRLGRKIPLHGGGVSVRSFIHIGDVAEGTRRVMLDGAAGECYHLSTHDSISIRDLVERICRCMGADPAVVIDVVGERTGKDLAYLLDTTKARRELNWSPAVSLDYGVDETIAWVDRHLDALRREPVDYVHKP